MSTNYFLYQQHHPVLFLNMVPTSDKTVKHQPAGVENDLGCGRSACGWANFSAPASTLLSSYIHLASWRPLVQQTLPAIHSHVPVGPRVVAGTFLLAGPYPLPNCNRREAMRYSCSVTDRILQHLQLCG